MDDSNMITNRIMEAMGQASALFMSQERKGTEIVMPTEDLVAIAHDCASAICCELARRENAADSGRGEGE